MGNAFSRGGKEDINCKVREGEMEVVILVERMGGGEDRELWWLVEWM